MSDTAGAGSWFGMWPWKRRRVRMAFPCPACMFPLLAAVEPDLELECPLCRTTFLVPAPPAPVITKPKAPVLPVNQVGPPPEGFLGTITFVLGWIVLAVGTVISCGTGLFLFGLIFATGTIVARIKNGLRRRKNPLLPKLSWSKIGYEGIKAIGISFLGLLILGLGAFLFFKGSPMIF